ncbi:MAG: lactate racemase domain-containing protein [Eubacteriales bacterium]|nr:lactate racemase domain-containing protein [Eubacteriales bacterium]
MSILENLLADIIIPRFIEVNYKMDSSHIKDVRGSVLYALQRKGTLDAIRPGQSVCIAVGSREIANISTVTRCVCDAVKSVGAHPFIIPAMGSHGGATAEGQREILAGYNITEETMGVPIRASMDTVKIGESVSYIDVRLDCCADGADYIIPIGRIKPHTDFRGKIESGLCKMMVIGMGKQYGAFMCHKLGFKNMAKNLIEFASVVIEKKPNMFSVGIIENAYHQTYKIVAVPANRVITEEPGLLLEAKEKIARLPFDHVDVLLIDQIGKDISGAGMDPNVTGRSPILGVSRPFFQSIAVFDLTDKSHHNFVGLGSADVTTRRVFNKMDFEKTYSNAITSAEPIGVKIPAVMPNDRTAIKFALHMATDADPHAQRVVWIHDTLSLTKFYISEALFAEVNNIPSIIVTDESPSSIEFDEDGNVSGWQ